MPDFIEIRKSDQDTPHAPGLDEIAREGARQRGLLMAFKLLAMAERRWRRINGLELLPLVRAGVKFVDGRQEERADQEAA